MKKVLLGIAILVSFAAAYEIEDFKKGYQAAIASIAFSAQNDGVQARELLNINKNILYIDTSKMPTSEILYTQYIAHREGFKTNVVENKLFLGVFDRLADAEEAQAKAKRLHLQTSIIKNNKSAFFSKSLITDIVVRELLSEGIYVDERIKYITKTVTVPAKEPVVKQERQLRNFKLKNFQAQAYELETSGSKNSSKYFIESQIIPSELFKSDSQVITNENEIFVKVMDKNIYFLIQDIEFVQ